MTKLVFRKSRNNISFYYPQSLRWWQRYLEILVISTKVNAY